MKIKIGTRGSKLALIQAEEVKIRLEEAYPQVDFELAIIQTKGDKILDKPLNQIGDKGLFVKEIEKQLLDNEIQMAVHSMKDMPSELPEGLIFSKLWKREDARDVLILREKKSLFELPENAVIGTGSARRKLQLLKLRPDLQVVDIRGNVDTRIRKMEELKLDGLVLAAAGLKRLHMEEKITCYLEAEEMVPAAAQGILALELQEDNKELLAMLNNLSDEESSITGETERAFLREMGGDCHTPMGAYCTWNGEKKQLHLYAVYGNVKEKRIATADVYGDTLKAVVQKAAAQIRKQLAGTVYLVGAGPGDEKLITVRGKELLETADCIIYDRLASPELLKFNSKCEKIYVGKEKHSHTLTQEEINRLMVQKAMNYKCVVRLKGGDPYVFGRGGEEGLALVEAGVSFEVVPGVTSATAGLCYAGIPITHRNVSSGFHVLTAHSKKDELADIDFKTLAKEQNTLVFLMGLGNLQEIVLGLMNEGKDKKTPVAVISKAATSEQKTVVSTLSEIVKKVKEEKVVSPALIVVGEVIRLRKALNFYEDKPLFGKHYLIPRIGKNDLLLSQSLCTYGADVTEVLLGEIYYYKEILQKKKLEETDCFLFTSRHGVEGFFKNLFDCGMDVRSLSGGKIAAIGEKTSQALKKYGIVADFIPTKADSNTLSKELKEYLQQKENSCKKLLYVRAKDIDNVIEEELQEICEVENCIVYENVIVENADEKEKLIKKQYDGIIFTCASLAERTATLYGGNLKGLLKKDGKIISIGPKCTEKLNKLGVFNVETAKKASYEELLKIITEVEKICK